MEQFPIDSVVRVKDPNRFIAEFARKVKDRDAIVKEALLDWVHGSVTEKHFRGRLLIEFQKRNGRGKVFTEVMHQRELVLQESKP